MYRLGGIHKENIGENPGMLANKQCKRPSGSSGNITNPKTGGL